MISAMDISTSALVAQRVRLNTISGNIANMSTLKNEAGENKPYQPRFDPSLGAWHEWCCRT